ncbi:MAG: hypothetical protein UHD64_02640 [Bacteroidales bacterium]|nr:hypothetical protein [Bacteroidales bacterium]
MLAKDLVSDFQTKKIADTKIAPNAVSDYLKKELEIKTYLPFRTKRAIVETVVSQNIEWVDGFKKIDFINEYVGFIVAILSAHTALEFSDDPVADYDLLAESGLLPKIIAEFQESYNECEVLLKMARTSELEDNNLEAVVSRFLNSILDRLDGVGESLKGMLGNFNIQDILGDSFKEEDLTKLKGFLDKYNK